MTFSEAVRELRRRLNLTQQALAFKTGLAVRTVSVYETGSTPGSADVLLRFRKLAAKNGFKDLSKIFLDSERLARLATITPVQMETLMHFFDSLWTGLAEIEKEVKDSDMGTQSKQRVQKTVNTLQRELTVTYALWGY